MARFLVLLKFNSQANADLFMSNPYNSSVLGATQATVESGFIGPSGPSTGLGQPSSAPSSGYTYVDIYVPSINSIPKGYYTGPNSPSATQLILDLNTRIPVYISPNIDPNTITLKEGDNTIINKGIPNPDWTPPDPTVDSPIEFKPIYYPNENPDDFYKQYLKLVADFPQDPNVMRPPLDPFDPLDPRNQQPPERFPQPPATPEDVTREPGYDPMAPYDDTPYPPVEGREGPRFFPDPMEIPDTFPPWIDPYIYKRSPDFSDKPLIQKISDEGPTGGSSATLAQNLVATGNVAFIAFQAAFATGNYKQTLWGSGSSGTNISTLQNGQFYSSTNVTSLDLTWTLTPFTVGTLVGLSGGIQTYSGNWGTGSGYSFNSVAYLSQDPNDAFFQSTWSQGPTYSDLAGTIAPPGGYFTGGLSSTLSSGGSTNVTGATFTDGATLYSKCDGGTANTVFTGVNQFINKQWDWSGSYVTYNGVNFFPVATSQSQGGKIYNCLFRISGR